MGVEPPEEFLVNNFCPRCFAPDQSPLHLICHTGGIQKSPYYPGVTDSAPNGKAWLGQMGPDCGWIGWSGLMDPVTVSWQAVQSQLVITVPGGAQGFVQTVPELCERYFVNNLQDPVLSAFYGGSAVVIAMEEVVAAISSVVPYFIDGARYEVYPGPGRIIDIRYANLKHRQNITLQFNIDEIT